MFERYTETARRVIFFARYEASQFGSPTIETEHLLLGIFREDRQLTLRFLSDQVIDELPEALPPEIVEAHERIQSIVQRMENAIANHEFEKARICSDEERKERENLRQLCEKYNLTNTSAGFIPEQGRVGEIRRRIESATQRRPKVSTSVDLPLSHESKRVLSFGAEEAERMSHKSIGPEHLFLGLLREESSLAARILSEYGLKLPKVREEIASHPPGQVPAGRPGRGAAFAASAARFGGQAGLMYALQDASRVLFLARFEAMQRQAACIETTDLLWALTREKRVADRFLGPVKAAIAERKQEPAAPRERVTATELPFSEDCKQVFGFTADEAAQLGERTGPEHLLLGILRVESCAAAEILRACGLTAAGIRAQLSHPPPSSDPGLSSGPQGRNYV